VKKIKAVNNAIKKINRSTALLLIGSFNFNFGSQYVLLGLTSCNTSNIVYYTVILFHKLVFLVLVRLIAIKNFNRVINHY